MPAPRDWMTLTIRPSDSERPPGAPGIHAMRPLTREDAERLARLMLDAYRGTVDDEGETLDDARRAVASLIAGEFGSVDWPASCVVEHGGELAAATIITRDRVAPPPLTPGEAFLAFSLTAPAFQRRGLARAGLMRTIGLLGDRGEARLHLVVTRTNTPAVRLYRSLGFVDGPAKSDRTDPPLAQRQ